MKEFPDPLDLRHRGSIAGKIITANPISLPVSPPNVTGISVHKSSQLTSRVVQSVASHRRMELRRARSGSV
jgi:hypothetical protein